MINHCHFHHHAHRIPRPVWGILVLIAGLALFGFNLGILPAQYKPIVFSWPSALILIGLLKLIFGRSFVFGTIVAGFGVYLLAPKLGLVVPGISQIIYPSLLILLGLIVLFRKRCCPSKKWDRCTPTRSLNIETEEVLEEGRIDEACVFSGSKRRFRSVLFKGGEVSCVFGGSELDFSEAQLPIGKTYLEVNCVFGGVTVLVPESWTVQIQVKSVFGDFVDRCSNVPIALKDPNRILVITGACVFGGGDIKYHQV